MGTGISIEIKNSKPIAISNNEKVNINNINTMINNYNYRICKINNSFNSAILFSLYKEMAISLYQTIECEKLIPNDDMSILEQNGNMFKIIETDENITKILKNMNNHINVRFQNNPEDAIFNPFLIMMVNFFFFPIIKVEGENKELSEEYSVLLPKAMYKDPEVYVNNIFSLLDPKFISFSKPHFIKFANKLNTSNVDENIIMGNLVKFIFLLLIAVTIFGSKCGNEIKLNTYIDDYIKKTIDINNTIDDDYIKLKIKEGSVSSYSRPVEKNKIAIKSQEYIVKEEKKGSSVMGTLYCCCYCFCCYIIYGLVIYAIAKLMSKKKE